MRKDPKSTPAGLFEPITVGQASEMIGTDIFGLLFKSSNDIEYNMVYTDYIIEFTKIKASAHQTRALISTFLMNQITFGHGAPARMVSD